MREDDPTQALADPAAEAIRFHRVGIGLMVPGAVAVALGAVLVGVGAGGSSSPKNCSVGKRCGDTCIEMTDVCHIPAGGAAGSGGGGIRPSMLISGAVLAALGIGFIIGSVFAFRRATRARERKSGIRVGRGRTRFDPVPQGVMLWF